MLMLVSILSLSLIGCMVYIHKLKQRLRAYEHIWTQIEAVADHNEDGTFNINVQHLEDAHQDMFEAHANDTPSGVRLLELDGRGSLGRVA